MKPQKKIYRTRAKALQIPKLAQCIMIINNCVSDLFSHLSKMAHILTDKKELRHQLFYVEKSLNRNLSKFSALMSEKMDNIVRKMRS